MIRVYKTHHEGVCYALFSRAQCDLSKKEARLNVVGVYNLAGSDLKRSQG